MLLNQMIDVNGIVSQFSHTVVAHKFVFVNITPLTNHMEFIYQRLKKIALVLPVLMIRKNIILDS